MKSKKALNGLNTILKTNYRTKRYNNDFEVLEIIKKRQIDIKDIIDTVDDYELYKAYCTGKGYADEYICTKKEFKVLKRWLENDN